VLFQDAATQLFNHTVEYEVAWGLEAQGVPAAQITPRVTEALARFDLLPLRQRQPWALSGGQQKRLALAAMWALNPRVLLLDEPLGGLDPQGRADVITTLDALRQAGTALLLLTRRLQATALAAQVACLSKGTLGAPKPTADLHARHTKLMTALIARGVFYPPEDWPPFGPQCVTPGISSALRLTNVDFAYPDGLSVLRNINVDIAPGEFVAIVGPNGAGKSTLVRHFIGLLRPTRGRVGVLGEDAAALSVGALARKVGFLFQRPEQQLFSATVREEVAYGPTQLQLPDVVTRVDMALARFGLMPDAAQPPAILSYGLQRAVTLAALAALETPILVLDEPTVSLDGRGWAQLLHWLIERRAAGVTLVVITHEMPLAARADRVIALQEGRVVADGPPEQVLPHIFPGSDVLGPNQLFSGTLGKNSSYAVRYF